MKTAFIAAPMPKTGTSYVQANLSLNREKLLSEGINYPASSSDKKAKKGGVTTGNGLLLFENDHQIESGDKGVIYHSEKLFTRLLADDGKNLHNLIDKLKQKQLKPIFIVYGRNILSHSFSCYTQRVVSRGIVQDYPSYIENTYKSPENFIELFNLIKSHDCELRFFNYSNISGDSFEHFLYEACSLDTIIKLEKFPFKVNESISHSDVELLRTFNTIVFRRDENKIQDLKQISRKLLARKTTIDTEEVMNPEENTKEKEADKKSIFSKLISKMPLVQKTSSYTNKQNPYPISENTYKILESKYGDVVNEINKLFGGKEKILIEPFKTVETTDDDVYLVSRHAIKTLFKNASEHDHDLDKKTQTKSA